MELAGLLCGGAPVIKSFQIAQTVSTVGIPLLASTGAEAGLDEPTTTGAADMVGVNLDTATYVTAQQTAFDAERTVKMIVNPDAIFKILLSGGGTSNTALTTYAVTTATTDGLDVASTNFGTASMDSGSVWFYTGVNAGQKRKITTWTNSTTADPTVAFERDHQVGDLAMVAPVWPGEIDTATITLTATFEQMDASVAVSTGAAEFSCIETFLGTLAGEGTTKSFILAVSNDHWLNKLA